MYISDNMTTYLSDVRSYLTQCNGRVTNMEIKLSNEALNITK